MGYEIRIIVGKRCLSPSPEIAVDETKPYKDGSGFEPLRDEKGDYVYTGRNEQWFDAMAGVELCKLGHQDDALNRLIQASFQKAKDKKDHVIYFYGIDGNIKQTEDRYGAKMWPVPVTEVLEAMKQTESTATYRRLQWAVALLEEMAKDPDQLEVLFYGH